MKNITVYFNDFFSGKPCMNFETTEYPCPEKFYGNRYMNNQAHLNIRL